MKLKAAATDGIAQTFVDYIDGGEFANKVYSQVLVNHLSVPPTWGPAEFYVQKSDTTVDRGYGLGCEVRLSGVSVKSERTPAHFERALVALANLYERAIKRFLPQGTTVQLFVSIMLDSPTWFHGKVTTLLEMDPVWVEGATESATMRV